MLNNNINKELQVQCRGCSRCGFPSDMIEVESFTPFLRMFYHKECFEKLGLEDTKSLGYKMFEVVRNGETD